LHYWEGCDNGRGKGKLYLINERRGGKIMPKRDRTGPPKDAAGPRDGRGKGQGNKSDKGAGSRTGGKKGRP
jgi:hypothetical protein